MQITPVSYVKAYSGCGSFNAGDYLERIIL
nr:spore germination protein [Chengkuizengella marina]